MSSFSSTVKVQGKNVVPMRSCAMCTLPKMGAEPTPTAVPAKRVSSKCMMPHRSAHAADMMVLCAPESTNAFKGVRFTSASMYSMVTRPKLSGVCSSAISMFASTLALRMASASSRCASKSMGLASSRALSWSSRIFPSARFISRSK